MIKEKMLLVRNFLFKSGKFVFPVIIVLAAAIAVFFTLRIRNGEEVPELAQATVETVETVEPTIDVSEEVVPMVENTIDEIYTLIATYYNAYATGDVDTIRDITNYLDEIDEIKIPEMSQYIEGYPEITIYTKTGPLENAHLVYVYFQMKMYGFEETISGMESFYVCKDANGKLYMNTGEVSEEEIKYIEAVNLQDDVAELSNRVTEECNTTFKNNTDLYFYIQEVVKDVQKTTGEILASRNSSMDAELGQQTENGAETEGEDTSSTTETEQTGPVYATATTTVNVRKSDSEYSDKITKVSGGTKVQVLEKKVNGWSKVIADGKEGYIKSEYLQMAETVTAQAIGRVTATTTVNVRMAPNQNAEKLGVLAGGDSADLLENVDDWCKINYNGTVGYVKAEYVR